MFTRLYRARKQSFPSDFARERQRIETLTDPTRATALDQLNAQRGRGTGPVDVSTEQLSSNLATPGRRRASQRVVGADPGDGNVSNLSLI